MASAVPDASPRTRRAEDMEYGGTGEHSATIVLLPIFSLSHLLVLLYSFNAFAKKY